MSDDLNLDWPGFANMAGVGSTLGQYTYTSSPSLTSTYNIAGSSITTSGIPSWPSTHSDLQVSGSANFDGDVTINGVNIGELLKHIQDRLAILIPDPVKLAKYQALQKAYDHYKLMEQLVNEEPTNEL